MVGVVLVGLEGVVEGDIDIVVVDASVGVDTPDVDDGIVERCQRLCGNVGEGSGVPPGVGIAAGGGEGQAATEAELGGVGGERDVRQGVDDDGDALGIGTEHHAVGGVDGVECGLWRGHLLLGDRGVANTHIP
mgnify:CR=1 FL=1